VTDEDNVASVTVDEFGDDVVDVTGESHRG
jgi:hypothetical protein